MNVQEPRMGIVGLYQTEGHGDSDGESDEEGNESGSIDPPSAARLVEFFLHVMPRHLRKRQHDTNEDQAGQTGQIKRLTGPPGRPER